MKSIISSAHEKEGIQVDLVEAGFAIEQECGDYQGNPISEMTHRAIIWAKKVR